MGEDSDAVVGWAVYLESIRNGDLCAVSIDKVELSDHHILHVDSEEDSLHHLGLGDIGDVERSFSSQVDICAQTEVEEGVFLRVEINNIMIACIYFVKVDSAETSLRGSSYTTCPTTAFIGVSRFDED